MLTCSPIASEQCIPNIPSVISDDENEIDDEDDELNLKMMRTTKLTSKRMKTMMENMTMTKKMMKNTSKTRMMMTLKLTCSYN